MDVPNCSSWLEQYDLSLICLNNLLLWWPELRPCARGMQSCGEVNHLKTDRTFVSKPNITFSIISSVVQHIWPILDIVLYSKHWKIQCLFIYKSKTNHRIPILLTLIYLVLSYNSTVIINSHLPCLDLGKTYILCPKSFSTNMMTFFF